MKVLVSAKGRSRDAAVDPRFGRAELFLVVDTETHELDVADNAEARDAMQGAGIQAAELAARLGVDAVITGHCGPKAYRALHAAGIRVVSGAAGTVAEALDAFLNGRLQAGGGPDVDGHWT
jgi:predicted Fe-Mo cluster-binding NifX family protein